MRWLAGADFEILDDWEDRYRHVIELGRDLPPLPEADHTAENKVRGCASQVWLAAKVAPTADGRDRTLALAGETLLHGADMPLFERYHARQLERFRTAVREGRIEPRGVHLCTGNVSLSADAYRRCG